MYKAHDPPPFPRVVIVKNIVDNKDKTRDQCPRWVTEGLFVIDDGDE